MYAVETHCLCELLNMYVIITKHALVSALLFSQSEQKVKSGIYTINHKICTKGLRKKVCAFLIFVKTTQQISYGASGFCKNYTTKTPLYIYYIISKTANAACIFVAVCYTVIVPDRARATKERRTEHKRMNRTRSEAREAGSSADGARRDNTGQRIHCKGGEQTEIRLQVLYCERGDNGRLPAIRAYKVKRTPPAQSGGTIPKGVRLINNHYQLIGVLKNDN